jgi:hypothetical protein
MKEYLLISKGNKQMWDQMSEADFKPFNDGFSTWISKLSAKNLWVRGDSLSNQKRWLTKQSNKFVDGPFAETKEVFTGFFIIRAENLEHATELAKGCPTLGFDKIEIFELEGDRS